VIPKLLGMSVFRPRSPEQEGSGIQVQDPRLAPTPDYGSLGPDSDFAKTNVDVAALSGRAPTGATSSRRPLNANLRGVQIATALGSIVFAALVSTVLSLQRNHRPLSPKRNSVSSAKFSAPDLEGQKAQKQAEMLLTRAVSRNDGATDEIAARVDNWRGKIKWNAQISALTTVALNSNDMNVRASGIEVQLAAYGLAKDESTLNRLILQADSADHAQKIWALWNLGLLGNRGVQSDRVVDVLSAHLTGSKKDLDEDSRHWAVEGLALVGTSATISPLLDAMHNDPSAVVRERAACSLAESGMLTHEQRMTAVPQLINYSDDVALDAQTRAWAFQALHDITKQQLGNDSRAWRSWYQSSVASGQ
jgi:hypothetical protein